MPCPACSRRSRVPGRWLVPLRCTHPCFHAGPASVRTIVGAGATVPACSPSTGIRIGLAARSHRDFLPGSSANPCEFHGDALATGSDEGRLGRAASSSAPWSASAYGARRRLLGNTPGHRKTCSEGDACQCVPLHQGIRPATQHQSSSLQGVSDERAPHPRALERSN